jgi:hypothetical protein
MSMDPSVPQTPDRARDGSPSVGDPVLSRRATDREDNRLAFLRDLVGQHTTIAGDVVELGARTWAVHGSIPVDGEAILAEFETEAEAMLALQHLPVDEQWPSRPSLGGHE